MAKQQIRILTLDHNQDGSSVVYKLCKGWILQFRLGTSLLGQSVCLHTNYPVKETDDDDTFDRTKYQELDWKSDSNNKADDTSMFANISIEMSGSFHFYLTNLKYKKDIINYLQQYLYYVVRFEIMTNVR